MGQWSGISSNGGPVAMATVDWQPWQVVVVYKAGAMAVGGGCASGRQKNESR
jgi:hypothetical protein